MNQHEFWNLVGRCRQAAGQDDRQFLQAVKRELSACSDEELGQFNGIMMEYRSIAYMPGLWEAATLIKTFCSDDSFAYFRAWLISQGKEVYLSALRCPDSLAELDIGRECTLEAFSYVADNVYRERTGEWFLPDSLCTLDTGLLDAIHAEIQYGDGVDVMHRAEDGRSFLPRLVKKYLGNQDCRPYWTDWMPEEQETQWGSDYKSPAPEQSRGPGLSGQSL